MDGSNGSSNSPAPFLLKTYEMVDDPLTNSIVSWSRTGHSFVVWNPPEFARDLLPKYFKHNNFSSFIRQLNTYGFRKVDPDQWEFANEEFIRGQRYLLKNIYRRKPVHSHSGQGITVPLTDSEREDFEKEIEKLKQEKISLQTEVERHKLENRRYEEELQSLQQTLQSIYQRQRLLAANLTCLLQKPGNASSLIEQPESPKKKRRLIGFNHLEDEANLMENFSPSCILNMEVVRKLDSSITFWEKFVHGMDQIPSNNLRDPRIVSTEMPLSSGETDFNAPLTHTPSPDSHSSPELAISATYVDSLEISSICLDMESKNKSPGVDMNTSPTETQVEKGVFPSAPAAGNDVFWQQFLTEVPASSTMQEVQSEQRERDDDMKDSSPFSDGHKPWWAVDNLAQRMGHFTRVEKT